MSHGKAGPSWEHWKKTEFFIYQPLYKHVWIFLKKSVILFLRLRTERLQYLCTLSYPAILIYNNLSEQTSNFYGSM